MSRDLFKVGGPHRIKKTGRDRHTFSISIAEDSDGRIARECPDNDCSPGEFKVTPGTGITDGQDVVYCPYCRGEAEPSDYTTKEQIRYAKDIVTNEATQGVERRLKDALGLDSRGKRSLTSGGLIDISMEMKPSRTKHVRRPYAEVLRRDVICPNCTLDHSVYGLATWCSDCGHDIFTTHVLGEIRVVRTILSDVPRRLECFGPRIAANDIENALEDLVSIFEATLRREIRRHAKENGETDDKIEQQMKRIGSRLQSVRNAIEILPKNCPVGLDHVDRAILNQLDTLFQKRNPITHNLGIVDRKYLERIRSSEQEGKDVQVSKEELWVATSTVFEVLESFHLLLFPGATKAEQDGADQPATAAESKAE